MKEPSFTIGIEEEYMLVDRGSRNLISETPSSMLPQCEKLLEGRVSPEFLQCQIEVGTDVCNTVAEARAELAHLRRTVASVAEEHGLALVAASTHPFAESDDLKHTPKARYNQLANDLQGVVRRLLISGMHVHVGVEDDELRIDLMGQVSYILPHLLALSTSSPFWRGHNTGLKSYRIAVWDEMPRTGLPEHFESFSEYERHVNVLVNAGVIEDATKIWWDIRPSHRFPTLEIRIADICTRLDDGVTIAALYLCWLRMLYRLREKNQRWRRYLMMLVKENRWRAQRYGIDEGLIDFGLGEIVPYAELMDEFIDFIAEDAEALDCVKEVNHTRDIIQNGTSAHRQIKVYEQALAEGASEQDALKAIVDMLIDDTLYGI
ncbi:MAG: carboxylate-amine ligase [Arenicellales bacterium]|nr:carboxylate-amine ligase [Arenicellales bacterium]